MMNKMLTVDTKRKIDSARDILVGKIPDPKAQVEQITTALIYKFMDDMDQEALEIGGKARYFTGDFEKYSWHKVMDTKLGAQERMNLYSEAIGKFQTNSNLPSLFRDIFKDSFLPFRNPETLTLFLRQINEFTYDHSEDLGDAYEYLLSIMGSQGDAGQFRTPRHIIEFIVKVVDPKKEDTVLDPACGTSGFLISAYKHILAQHDGKDDSTGEPINSEKRLTPQDRSQITKNFVGYDISPDMVRISEVNMFLHDFTEPKIFEYDTLSSEDKWDDRFDVILANPPFMSPKGGIRPHKRFSIQANRSEVLFVDYIMEHLKPKGRAGIIVPEGIIFQSSNAYVELRKKLIEDGLFCVVSLPSGVFQPYSGVKTSILLFDNEISKKSDNILFVKVSNDGYELGAQRKPTPDNDDFPNVLKLISAFKNNPQVTQDKIYEEAGLKQPAIWGTAVWGESVWAGGEEIKIISREEISKSGDYNLTGTKYAANERGAEVKGKWQIAKLGEVSTLKTGGTPLTSRKEYYGGNIKWLVSGDIHKREIFDCAGRITELALKESNARLLPVNSVLIALNGQGKTRGTVAILKTEAACNQSLVSINPDKSKLVPEFLFYILRGKYQEIRDINGDNQRGGLNMPIIRSIEVPIPPLEVQKQIVEELSKLQIIIDGARQIVDSWKPSINIQTEWNKVKLADICDGFQYGSSIRSLSEGDIPCLRMGNIQKGEIDWTNLKYATPNEEIEKYLLKDKDVLFNRTNSPDLVGKTAIYRGDRSAVFAGYLIRVLYRKELIIGEYLNYLLNSDYAKEYYLRVKTDGVSQSNINAKLLSQFEIPLPPVETQRQIVNKIEEERIIVESNKKLISIYEAKIKDKMATIWEESNG